MLVPELVTSLVMLHEELPMLLQSEDWLDLFLPLLESLERYNSLTPGIESEDEDDLGWPGIIRKLSQCFYYTIKIVNISSIEIFFINQII